MCHSRQGHCSCLLSLVCLSCSLWILSCRYCACARSPSRPHHLVSSSVLMQLSACSHRAPNSAANSPSFRRCCQPCRPPCTGPSRPCAPAPTQIRTQSSLPASPPSPGPRSPRCPGSPGCLSSRPSACHEGTAHISPYFP